MDGETNGGQEATQGAQDASQQQGQEQQKTQQGTHNFHVIILNNVSNGPRIHDREAAATQRTRMLPSQVYVQRTCRPSASTAMISTGPMAVGYSRRTSLAP